MNIYNNSGHTLFLLILILWEDTFLSLHILLSALALPLHLTKHSFKVLPLYGLLSLETNLYMVDLLIWVLLPEDLLFSAAQIKKR